MSHRESALMPWIASYTDSFSAAGASTLTLTGFGLGLSTDVDLGTLGTETGRTYTATDGDGNGNLVISLNVATLPSSPATVQVTVGNGGVPAVQSPLSVQHGWSPEVLVKSASDGWFNPSGMAKNSNSTGYEPADGDAVVEWRVNGTTSGLSKLFQSDAVRQPVFIAEHTNWDSSTNHPCIGPPSAGGQRWLNNANDGTWDRLDADNYTIAMAHTTFNVTDANGNLASGRAHIRWTNGERPPPSGYSDYLFDAHSNPTHLGSNSRGVYPADAQSYTKTDGASTRLIALRRNGSTASVFYNSGTAVQTYTVAGTTTDTAHFGVVQTGASAIAEALFLKYAASDSEMASLMSYWSDKYGS